MEHRSQIAFYVRAQELRATGKYDREILRCDCQQTAMRALNT